MILVQQESENGDHHFLSWFLEMPKGKKKKERKYTSVHIVFIQMQLSTSHKSVMINIVFWVGTTCSNLKAPMLMSHKCLQQFLSWHLV